MKKLLFFSMLLGTMLTSCDNVVEDMNNGTETNIKETELFVYSGGNKLNATRSSYNPKDELGYSIPDNGRYHVYYYVRIDNNIPGEDQVNLPAAQYFPRTSANKTLVSDANHGLIEANAEWRQCKGFSKYIWSPDGSAIQSIIVEQPTIEALLNADKGHTSDGMPDDFTGILEHKDELHFLWYACKKQDADHVWHIDGILTTKDRTDISQTAYGDEITENYNGKGMVKDYGDVKRKASVEVDVHQQEHKDWNEIKTSIHLRDTVAVEVFLPIDYQELADDFDIRAGKDYVYVTEIKNTEITIGEATYNLEVSIKHEPTGIRITVLPNKEALKAARLYYDDGLTFEVHSYVTSGIDKETIWSKLKKTTVTPTPYTTLTGQITSAYFADRIDL